METKFVRIS